MSINLLPKNLREKNKYASLRKNLFAISSIALVCYIVIFAGVAGWWLFLAQQDSSLSSQAEADVQQIKALSQSEAVVRQLADRATQIQTLLDARQLASTHVQNLQTSQVAVNSWTYDQKSHLISVSAANPAEIEAYAKSLGEKYPRAVVKSINSLLTGTWDADIVVDIE